MIQAWWIPHQTFLAILKMMTGSPNKGGCWLPSDVASSRCYCPREEAASTAGTNCKAKAGTCSAPVIYSLPIHSKTRSMRWVGCGRIAQLHTETGLRTTGSMDGDTSESKDWRGSWPSLPSPSDHGVVRRCWTSGLGSLRWARYEASILTTPHTQRTPPEEDMR
jgi:hypothetical protein